MTVARQYHTFQIHYLYKTFNFNDPNISVSPGVTMDQKLPKNCIPLPLTVFVEVAFNAGTTNTLTIGDSVTPNRFAQTADTTLGTVGEYININRTVARPATDLDVFVLYTQTGTAASAGKATIIFPFVPDQTQF